MPNGLDHIVLGCADLDSGVAYVERATGIRAAFGGTHPGRGTRNALLSLGERRYLEILAPDPAQHEVQPWLVRRLPEIATLSAPKLVGWALEVGDIEKAVENLRRSHIDVNEPSLQSRLRSGGSVLKWKIATMAEDRSGTFPFLIQWDSNCAHPAPDAPTGCRLERFVVATPDAREMDALFHMPEADIAIEAAPAYRLRAVIAGPSGVLHMAS